MSIQTRTSLMEVKQIIIDMMKEDTNINVVSADVLIKLLETREEFWLTSLTSSEHNLKVIENMNMDLRNLHWLSIIFMLVTAKLMEIF